MKVTIKLFATLKQYGPEEQETTVPDESTVEDIIKTLKIPDNIPLLRIVNGVHVDIHHTLREGDVLALFPPIAGGCTVSSGRNEPLSNAQRAKGLTGKLISFIM